ncbi:hypothetical protein LZC95_19695 [Pendulispora brunnea]|uniref:Uncharacterized protein n=1 Tax=Pendulispora brunnea TaxID=2905690 RepID=A0ABZ2KK36_9BACT
MTRTVLGMDESPVGSRFAVAAPCPKCGAKGLDVVERFAAADPTTCSLAGVGMKVTAKRYWTWACATCGGHGRAHPPAGA